MRVQISNSLVTRLVSRTLTMRMEPCKIHKEYL